MKRYVPVLIGVAVIGIVGSHRSIAGGAKTELEGTWELVAIEADGKELKAPKDAQMVTTGNKFVLKTGDKVVIVGTFKVDASTKPKTIDVTYTEGPDKGKSFKGIYEVDGDTSRFCRPLNPEDARPTEFKTKAGGGVFLATYKRAKK
jgi:uncharacterized protein (TIGR03067 family)